MNKTTHPFVQLLMMVLLSVGLLIAVSIPTGVLAYQGVDINSRTNMFWLQSITQLLTFALPVFLMTLIYYRGRQREYYRFNLGGRQWLNALTAAVILLLLLPAIDWLTVWNDGWNLGRVGEMLRSLQDTTEGLMQEEMNTDTVSGLLGNLVLVAVIPAFCEELFFRAGIQNLLQRWWSNGDARAVGTHVAVWVTAVIFSLGHGEIFSFMPRFLMGLLLGYVYIYSGSLLVNMVAHFVNNALVVLIYWLVNRGVLDIDPEAPLALGWPVVVCCSLAAVVLFVATFGKRLKTND